MSTRAVVRLGQRFALYGAAGWLIEVVMTGVHSVVETRDPTAVARTYLWMHPIYGFGGLALEALFGVVRRWPLPARCLVYLPVIYGLEYASGHALRRWLGRCPWDYGDHRRSLAGLVRLDYAPLWLLAGCAFELTRALAFALTTPRRPWA